MSTIAAIQRPVALENIISSDKLKIQPRHATASELATKYSHHINGKTIFVTGASPQGLGAEFAISVAASAPATIILAGPSLERLTQTASAIKSVNPRVQTPIVQIDLGSIASVRNAAAEVDRWVSKIDVLVLNAGVMGGPYQATVDGLERQFGTNHIGHFLLANLLMPKLLAADCGARVISVTSEGHLAAPVFFDNIGFDQGKTYDKWMAYGQSKTANALFAVELASRLQHKDILAYAVHPGLVATGAPGAVGTTTSGIGRRLTADDLKILGVEIDEKGEIKVERPEAWKTIQEGAATHVYAAFDPELVASSGSYLTDVRIANDRAAEHARSSEAAHKLWKLSENLVGQKFDI